MPGGGGHWDRTLPALHGPWAGPGLLLCKPVWPQSQGEEDCAPEEGPPSGRERGCPPRQRATSSSRGLCGLERLTKSLNLKSEGCVFMSFPAAVHVFPTKSSEPPRAARFVHRVGTSSPPGHQGPPDSCTPYTEPSQLSGHSCFPVLWLLLRCPQAHSTRPVTRSPPAQAWLMVGDGSALALLIGLSRGEDQLPNQCLLGPTESTGQTPALPGVYTSRATDNKA